MAERDRAWTVFVIAGEASGDTIAARMMAALARISERPIRFAGIGGPQMAAQGFVSLFPMRELSLMGLAEIVPHIPRLLRRINETAREVERLAPDIVVTVDSPGFTFRVARRIRHLPLPIVHYVAPQLWAWRPGRARKIATLVDALIAVLPFEPAFFKQFEIPCSYAGHPAIEGGHGDGDGAAFRVEHEIAADAPVLAVLPGSRGGEVSRLAPILGETLGLLAKKHPGLTAVVPTVDTVAEQVRAAVGSWPVRTIVVADTARHRDVYAASRAALTKSGTSTLHLALAGVPMVVCYKMHWLTAFLARRLVKLDHVSLVNILAEREVVPEYLLADCTAENLAAATAPLLDDGDAWDKQCAGLSAVVELLKVDGNPPSEQAAQIVLGHLEKRSPP